MNYSPEVRKSIKAECKEIVKNRLGACVGIQFLYLLPFMLIGIIMMISMIGNLAFATGGLLTAGYGYSELAILQAVSGMIGKFFLCFLIMILIAGPLEYGLMKFYIELRRGENPSVTTLFRPFTSGKSLWTGIKMIFCVGFRSFLWMLVPYIVFVALIAFAMAMESITLVVVSYILMIVVFIFIGIKVATYEAGWFVINDDENYGVWAATRDASSVFKGHYKDVLVFFLSFIGWSLLAGLITGIASGLGNALGSGVGVILSLVASVATVIIGAFVSAYQQTSYLSLYEYFVSELRGGETASAQTFGTEE